MPKFTVVTHSQIEAPPERVFEVVADFGTWTTWSPWLCSEPDAKVTVSDNPNSIGSVYEWDGNVIGAGEIEHKELVPGRRIVEELRFTRPWTSQSDVSFDFEPQDGGTKITWTMNGSLPWFMFWMKKMMVNMIGMDYERGLKMLKEHIETGQVTSQTTVHGVKPIGPLRMIGIRKKAKLQEIGNSMSEAIAETERRLGANNVLHEGQTMAVYHCMDMATRTLDYTAGVIVNDSQTDVEGLSSWSLPETQALAVEHVGCYSHLGNAWSAAHAHLRHRKLKQNSKAGTFEIYRNTPEDTPPAELITDIYLPVK